MKRVLIFSTAYYPFVGGAEVAIKEITDRLPDYHFDLLTIRKDPKLSRVEKIGAVTVYRLGIGMPLLDKLLAPWIGAFYALRLRQRGEYDAYWAMMVTYMSGAAYIANIFSFWNQVPIILTLQEGDSENYIKMKWGGLVGLSWYLALGQARLVTVISSYLKEQARAYGYRGDVVLIPNGVDASLFVGELRSHAGTVLITTSRLTEKNALDDVIRALPRLPEITFKILGTGPDEQKLRALTKELQVENRVELVGFVDHKDIPSILHGADIFIRPSRSEGMGNSFIEAMAAGLPVIATQEGGISDFLFDAKRNPDKETTGWAVDKNSPEQIVEAVKDILSNPEQVKKVTETAQKMVIEKYDWDLIAKEMRDKVFGILL